MLGWKRRQRAKERDWPPVGPPLIVGVKIESVSQTWVPVQRTGQASPIQKGRNRQSAAAVGARFWSRQELVWQRRTSTHSEHRKAGAVDSDQLWATGTGSLSGKARAFWEKRNGMEPCDARAVQRRTTSASENAGTTRQGQQGPERGSGRPAGHAAALQIDGSHRLQS
jgi:hypothetical protein